jgi:hypothetical protein
LKLLIELNCAVRALLNRLLQLRGPGSEIGGQEVDGQEIG